MIQINDLGVMASAIAGKRITIKNISGPEGVRGRRSDNRLIAQRLGWQPSASLRAGLEKTYAWIAGEIARQQGQA
jgi:GDP-D-mannose 3', 5'-epimerase